MGESKIILPGEVAGKRSDLKAASKAVKFDGKKSDVKDFNKLKGFLTRSNLVVDWQELSGQGGILFPNEEAKMREEARINSICRVLAIGPETETNGVIKVGHYVLMGGAGRLVTLDGCTYGIIKEHMVDACFEVLPKLGKDEGSANSGITTKVTSKELDKFANKHAGKYDPQRPKG